MNIRTNLILGTAIALLTVASAHAGNAVDFGGVGGMGIPVIQGLPGGPGGPSNNPAPSPHGNIGGNSAGNVQAVRAMKLACVVGGTPVEFPNDIWVTNTTKATLVKGTALSFSIPSIGVKGTFLLPANVPAGQQVKVADIFGGAEAGSPCTVTLS